MTEEELIKQCQLGQRSAQELLYRMYSPKLFGICLKYSSNKIEAEDNLHDSFMTIYEKIHQFENKGSFEGWLKRITVNTVLQKYRKTGQIIPLSEPIELPDVEQSETLTEIPMGQLLQFIQELPRKYRITFNMYVLDGYSHKEISAALGTSEGTSKSNLARARSILKDKLKSITLNIT